MPKHRTRQVEPDREPLKASATPAKPRSLAVTPGGSILVVDDEDSLPALSEAAGQALESAFAQSTADGLLLLASPEFNEDLPPALVYWRGLARQFFQAACQLTEAELAAGAAIAAPAEEQLAQSVEEAPPMRGLEYLNVELLRSHWQSLGEAFAARSRAFPQGPAAYLRSVNPLWHLLGRVTFHLAENKRQPERPFAFLATYTHELSGKAKLRHLPLADALKNYAGAGERAKLESLLEPVRRAAVTSELVRKMLDTKALFAPQAWSPNQAHQFLIEAPRIEEAGVVVRLPNWWSARRPVGPQVNVRIGSRPQSALAMDSLLDFQAELTLDGESLTEAEREQLLQGTDGLVLLRGKWVQANRQQLEQALSHWRELAKSHPHGLDFISGMRMLAGAKLDASDVLNEQVAAGTRVVAGDWLQKTLQRMREPDSDGKLQPGRDLQATLRPYQVDGVRWLWFMTELGLGACLADDMGLGKTIQIIDLLLARKRQAKSKGPGPSLLVVPASLLGNWRAELARFGPTLQAWFAHRSECDPDELARAAQNPQAELAPYDLVVTTYGLLRRQEWLTKVDWSLVILDEAQSIKNAGSAQTKAVKKLSAKGRIVLTGTPVENHLGDLWSLFDFCCPGLLGAASQFKAFVKKLSERQDAQAFGALRKLVQPYILRRMKTDPAIVPDLPAKTEMRTECGLSKKQAALYERAVEDLHKRLENSDGMARRGLVLAALMQFKQICNHPAQYLATNDFAPQDSGKFERLRLLCEPIVERQEKALIFTQFQSLTNPLAEYLATVFGRPGLVLDGKTPVGKRSERVRNFQSDQGPPFFVISLKAGGSGLNLTGASHVIHFDRWWNPAVENQATDRAFRIGQKRNVLVHKFVCRGTVEERIDDMLRDKQALADQVLNQEAELRVTEMNDDELMRFVAIDIERATADE